MKLNNSYQKFHSTRPAKGTSLSQIMWFEVPSIRIHHRVPENGHDKKSKKKQRKKLGNKICAASPYWADEPLRAIIMKVGL
jgi:hypothetical protein